MPRKTPCGLPRARLIVCLGRRQAQASHRSCFVGLAARRRAKEDLSGHTSPAYGSLWAKTGRLLMKYHVRCLASAVLASIALERAGANAPGGANWFLRAPDGSSQGPYGLSQLGEWSSSGYVSVGESCGTHK